MPNEVQTTQLVGKMVDLVGGKVQGPPWSEAESLYEPILDGGRETLLELIGMLDEVDDGSDWKVRYTLHGIATYVAHSGHDGKQIRFIEALREAILSERPKPIRTFLVQQAQVTGDRRLAPTLGGLLHDAELDEPAAQALVAIRDGAAEQFRKALSGAQGKSRLTIVQGLASLEDEGSAEALREAARDEEREVRLAAIRGLAEVGDPEAHAVVLKAAKQDGWERIQGVKAALRLGERLEEKGHSDAARSLYRKLLRSRRKPAENYVREIVKARL